MEIGTDVEEEIERLQKYLKKKIGADCSDSLIVGMALDIARRVGGDYTFVSEYNHGGRKK